MRSMKALALPVFALALTVPATTLADEDAVELEPLTVTAPVSPLDQSQRLLRLLIERTAPCLGCDAVLARSPESRTVKLLKFLLLPAVPPEVDESARLAAYLRHDHELEFLEP